MESPQGEINTKMEDGNEMFNKIKTTELELSKLKDERYVLNVKIKSLETHLEELRTEYNIMKLKNMPDQSYWSTEKFEWTDKLTAILKEKFRFDSFRPKQLAAINATMSNKDCILVIPTGGGKSLTYMLPAAISKKLTLVISPLISLISDQMIALEKFGIKSACLNGTSSKVEKRVVHDDMCNPESTLRVLFVTPEWIAKSKIFFNHITKCYAKNLLERIVIDEVHCCSTWGHDFRPDYSQLNFFKTSFENVPLLGLTATATMQVLNDVQKMLDIPDAVIITAPFNRPNLFYKVVDKPESKGDCLSYIFKLINESYKDKSGIIYVQTIKDCDELTVSLKDKGVKVGPYHANLEPDNKKRVHERWLNGRYQVVVATIAFGMGIDKPDVRFVIHHSVPKSMEGLYQESGRAGRDGQRSDCIILFSLGDVLKNFGMSSSVVADRNAMAVMRYCLNVSKRQIISKFFDDTWMNSMCDKMCDVCDNSKTVYQYDIKKAYDALASIIAKAEDKLTLIKLVNAWFQKSPKQNKLAITKTQANTVVAHLLDQQYFKVTKGATLYGYVAYIELKGEVRGQKMIASFNSNLKGFKLEQSEIILDDSDDENVEPPKKKKKD